MVGDLMREDIRKIAISLHAKIDFTILIFSVKACFIHDMNINIEHSGQLPEHPLPGCRKIPLRFL